MLKVIVFIVAVLLFIGFAYEQFDLAFGTDAVACTEEAMLCPDGSYVGRTGPSCQFVCP